MNAKFIYKHCKTDCGMGSFFKHISKLLAKFKDDYLNNRYYEITRGKIWNYSFKDFKICLLRKRMTKVKFAISGGEEGGEFRWLIIY